MIRLGWRLLPYAMFLGGLLFALTMVPTLIKGSETEPTLAKLAEITNHNPDKQWLKIEDGTLFLPEAFVDQSTNEKTGKTKDKAWYVPLLSAKQIAEHSMDLLVEEPGKINNEELVLVKFSNKDFTTHFPNPDAMGLKDMIVPMVIDGRREKPSSYSTRFDDYIQHEMGKSLRLVTVIEQGQHPLQRGEAFAGIATFAVVSVLGLFWSIQRWKPKKQPAAALAGSNADNIDPNAHDEAEDFTGDDVDPSDEKRNDPIV